MENKTAVVFGGSGLTGNYLVKHLLKDSRYNRVKIFLRRPFSFPENSKAEKHIVEIDMPEKYKSMITGDDLFCCLGTTIAKAGSRAAFRKLDCELPIKVAEISVKNGMNSFLAVSSIGAHPGSSNFYLRTKGEMERDIQKLAFKNIVFLQPSMLLGERSEFRLGEMGGKALMNLINPILLGSIKKYRAINAETVAMAMISLANENSMPGVMKIESDKIQELAEKLIR